MSTMVLDPIDFAQIAYGATRINHARKEDVLNAVVKLSEANARAYNVRYWDHEETRNDPATGYTRDEIETSLWSLRGKHVLISDCLRSLRSLDYNLDDQKKEVEQEYGLVESGMVWALIERFERTSETW